MKLGLKKGEIVTYKKEVLEDMLKTKLLSAKTGLFYDMQRNPQHLFMTLFLEVHNISKYDLRCVSNTWSMDKVQGVDTFCALAYYLFTQNERKIKVTSDNDSDYIITGI
mgnify:CR=1 FL=1